MKPNAQQLIESISWSLDTKVAPAVDDRWAASTLRSVGCLLAHLRVRVEIEGQALHDDNADLDRLAPAVAAELGEAAGALAGAIDEFSTTCAKVWRDGSTYPTVESMTDENEHKMSSLETLISILGSVETDASTAEALTLIDAYIARRLARDQPMFAPAFMSATF